MGGGKGTEEWHDALLVAVFKKGDLLQCDNWRGISLLDTMGKLFGNYKRKLQELAEEVLSNSQYGFVVAGMCRFNFQCLVII